MRKRSGQAARKQEGAAESVEQGGRTKMRRKERGEGEENTCGQYPEGGQDDKPTRGEERRSAGGQICPGGPPGVCSQSRIQDASERRLTGITPCEGCVAGAVLHPPAPPGA